MSNDNPAFPGAFTDPAADILPYRSNGLALLEGAILIGGLGLIDHLGIVAFSAWPVHPLLFAVMMMAAQYGLAGGILSALASAALYYLVSVPDRPIDMTYAHYFWVAWAQPVSWVFAGLTVGIVTSHRTRLLAEQTAKLQKAVRAERLIAGQYRVLAERTHQLERSLAGRADSATDIEKARRQKRRS